MNRTLTFLILLLSLIVATGCAGRLDRRTSEWVDVHLEEGMSTAELMATFPQAEFWREQDGRAQYMVPIHKRCFWCYSKKGFQYSREYYVRIAQFENDRLVSVDPVELKR